MVQRYFLIMLSSFLLFGCSTGSKSLNRGDYDLAVYQAVKRLQQSPDHKKASEVLRKAYTLAVERHLDNVRAYDLSNDNNKWELMAKEYGNIEYLNNLIKSYPEYKSLVELVDVSAQLANTRHLASKEFTARGKMYMAQGTKESARSAYYEFDMAEQYDPGNDSIIEWILESREAGTVNVAIQFPNDLHRLYYLPSDDIYHEIKNAASQLNFTFLRIINVNHPYLMPDEIIQLRFDDIFIGHIQTERKQTYMVKDDVLVGTEQVNDSTKKEIYGEVNAKFRHWTKYMNSSAEFVIRRIDGRNGNLINKRRIPSTFNWTAEWGTFSGDKRALNQRQRDLLKLEEPPAPNRGWVFDQLCVPIYNGSLETIRRYYGHLR